MHIFKSSGSMYESSGSKFFRTTTVLQSVQNVFDESRLVMASLTNFEVTEILCSFELILQKKEGTEIPQSSRSEFVWSQFVINVAFCNKCCILQ